MEYTQKRLVIASFELIILFLSLFSYNYVIEQTTDIDENVLFPMLLAVVDSFFDPVIPLVSAAGVQGCCGVAESGALCVQTDSAGCAENFAGGAQCSSVNFCQKGCCYNDSTGVYDEGVLESVCNADWSPDPFCNLPGAQLGCCLLGETSRFETEGQCRVHSDVFALSADGEYDWRAGLNEVECILLAGDQKLGACVLDDNDCKFGTEADCYNLGGEFSEGLLCTADELGTACEMTTNTRCVDGKDGVYFVDSCGNTANIYDSSKVNDPTYWRNHLTSQESCQAPNGARNSATCGNCNRFEGGICAPAEPDDFDVAEGDYYCKDTACTYTDYWGQNHFYKNGESWCVYDSDIDDGDDAPGSRHFRYICNRGDVQVEPCADFRNEICVEQDTLRSGDSSITGTVEFNNAYCRKNNAKHCIEIGERSTEACNDEPDCMVRSVNVGGSFDFDICLPKYPEGFSYEPEYQATGSQVCAINTRTCVVTFQSVLFGCVCIDNCGCLNGGSFNSQMDEVCTALGDCKGSSNVQNFRESEPVRGKVAEYDSRIEKYMLAAGLGPDDYLGVGSALFEQSAFSGALFAAKLDSNKQPPTPGQDNSGQQLGAILGALGGLLASLGGILGSTMMMVAGMALSLMGALAGLLGQAMCPPQYIDYNCNLYSPPSGAGSCDYCNNQEDIPCTEYRCNSLGAACEFINQGTQDELCIAAADDGGFPVIEHILSIDEIISSENLYDFPELLEFIQDTKYEEIENGVIRITNENGGCVDAYSPAPISFQTNEPAQCKFDIEVENEGYKDFADMEYYVGLNTYTFNHSTFFQLPDPSHGVANGAGEVSDELSVYIKCRDRYGHEMPEYIKFEMCVNHGEDETPPRLVTSYPRPDTYVSFGSESFDLQMITNELATCRWSKTAGVPYSGMNNSFVCNDTFFTPSSTLGYVCNGELPIDQSGTGDVSYYVKCSDQPWLVGQDANKRNANAEDIEFTFIRPTDKITIDSIRPEGELSTTADKLSLTLEVRTSAGANEHLCSYSFSGYDTMIKLYETGSPGLHLQEFNLAPSRYDVYLECVDETGDSVRSTTSFRVLKKSGTPVISRTWQSSGNLYFTTEGEADCRYSSESCSFDFDSGEPLTGDGVVHRIFAAKGKEYFVKCQDELGNVPTGCSIVLSAV